MVYTSDGRESEFYFDSLFLRLKTQEIKIKK